MEHPLNDSLLTQFSKIIRTNIEELKMNVSFLLKSKLIECLNLNGSFYRNMWHVSDLVLKLIWNTWNVSNSRITMKGATNVFSFK